MHLYDAAFYLALFGLVGIGLAVFDLGGGIFVGVALLIAFLVIELGALLMEKRSWMVVGWLLLLAGGLGFLRGEQFLFKNQEVWPAVGEETLVEGRVIREPEFQEKNQKLRVELLEPYAGRATIYTDIFYKYRSGDILEVKGVIREGKYNNFYWGQPKIEVKENEGGVRAVLYKFKEGMTSSFKRFLPSEESALLAGMTFGERSGFSEEFKENLNKSGTTHIVALSGYNITILVIAVGLFFGYFFSRRITFYLSIGAIGVFVVMVGGEPSIVRAAVMGVISLLAIQVGRIYSVRNAITISACLMVAINPEAIVDVGFQLSFMALLGIVYFLPAVKKWLGMEGEISFLNWKDNLLATGSAQVMVLPLILYHFQSFSLWSLVSNTLILEFVSYVMLAGFILGVVSFLGAIGYPIAWLASGVAWVVLKYQITVINFFARDFSLNFEWPLSVFLMGGVIYYLLLIIFIRRWLYN